MPPPTRSELATYLAGAAIVAVLGWWALRPAPAPPAAGEAPVEATGTRSPADGRKEGTPARVTVRDTEGAGTLVHVVGAVRRPGVYRLEAGARVQDAIRRAGGAASGADLQGLNLAAKVTDAQQVVVPRRVHAGSAGASGVAAPPAAMSGTADPDAARAGAGVVPTGGPAASVNLNTATLAELDTLDGVGPATAQKILDFRTQQGGFHSIDQLADVPGIGPKRLEAIRARVHL